MDIKLVAPFRIPFELPRDAILSNHDSWIQHIANVQQVLAETDLPGASLGNYAWSKLLDIRKGTDQLYGGKGGSNDPGWFFRSHYLLKTASTGRLGDVFKDDTTEWIKLFANDFNWECQLIDNTIAVMIINLKVNNISELCRFFDSNGQTFYDGTNKLMAEFLQDQQEICNSTLQWIDKNLFKPNNLPNTDCNKKYLDQQPPVYRELFLPFWTHRAYSFSTEEYRHLTNSEKIIFGNLLSPENKASWLANGGFYYDWGATIVVKNPQYDRQWLDALIVSQYYYACLDLIDTTLPVAISVLRQESQRGHHKRVLDYARKTYSKINTLINDYNNLRLRTASEAYTGVKTYYASWRMENLTENVKGKLELYRELIELSSDKINKSTQSFIENFLFGITLLSLVGLFASLHDYLAGAYDPRDPEALPSLALSYGKDDLLITSVFVMLILFAGYMWLIRRRR